MSQHRRMPQSELPEVEPDLYYRDELADPDPAFLDGFSAGKWAARPMYKRLDFWTVVLAVWLLTVVGTTLFHDSRSDGSGPLAADPLPQATVTQAVTATPEARAPRPGVTETVTATPKPEATVTEKVEVAVTETVTPEAAEEQSVQDGPGAEGGDGILYEDCAEAESAGAAPVHRGDPGYGGHLDVDGDGTGCEVD